MKATQQHDLKLGDSVVIKRGIITKVCLLYAGMPNEHTLSLVVIRTAGHTGMAYNLYLPAAQRQITIAEVPVTLHSASPTTVLLTVNAQQM